MVTFAVCVSLKGDRSMANGIDTLSEKFEVAVLRNNADED